MTFCHLMNGKSAANYRPPASLLRGGLARKQVRFPGGQRRGILVGGVAAPQRLDEHRRRTFPSREMFLSLLLLHLERETRSQNPLQSDTNTPPPKTVCK